jgi:hypothetical protein
MAVGPAERWQPANRRLDAARASVRRLRRVFGNAFIILRFTVTAF